MYLNENKLKKSVQDGLVNMKAILSSKYRIDLEWASNLKWASHNKGVPKIREVALNV